MTWARLRSLSASRTRFACRVTSRHPRRAASTPTCRSPSFLAVAEPQVMSKSMERLPGGFWARSLAAASLVALAAGMPAATTGCTDGTTPDCTQPQSACGPDLDATAPTEASADAPLDAPAPGDAPSDGPSDASFDGDAPIDI